MDEMDDKNLFVEVQSEEGAEQKKQKRSIAFVLAGIGYLLLVVAAFVLSIVFMGGMELVAILFLVLAAASTMEELMFFLVGRRYTVLNLAKKITPHIALEIVVHIIVGVLPFVFLLLALVVNGTI